MDKINSTKCEPLVTIVAVTYNSSKHIIELLDSIYRQSYKNIELIITDDASKDNTVEICNKWVNENKNRFINTKIITAPKNTGTASNCNRGLREVRGEWVKLMAGDDVLFDSAIMDNILFISNSANSQKIVYSGSVKFKYNISNKVAEREWNKDFYDLTAKEQLSALLDVSNIKADIQTPSTFIKYQTLQELDYFDERFPFFEDFPFLCKATSKGIKLHYFDKETVHYRVEESIQRDNSKYMNERYHESRKLFFLLEKQKYYNSEIVEHKISLLKQKYELLSRDIIINYLGNKRGILTKIWIRFNSFLVNKKIKELLK